MTDQGPQFQSEYRDWCRRNEVRPRFGAVGKKGSIAVIERFILSLKSEFLWKIFVPASQTRTSVLLAAYQLWYNEHRPNDALGGRTPAEVRDGGVSERQRILLGKK